MMAQGNSPAVCSSSAGHLRAVISAQCASAAKESDLISRYTREEMGRIWSEQNRFQKWLEVELAAAETLAEVGIVPREAAVTLRARARVDAARIQELEARIRHDVVAFTMAVGESVNDPEAARWLHYGLTSNDVVDTAQALVVREASELIEAGLERFGKTLER